MNKKITVYDLINRIRGNKDIPKKLKYGDAEYIYEHFSQDYVAIDDGSIYLLDAIVGLPGRWLNREVEILEDEEEIDIEEIGELPEDFDASFYDEHSIKANRYKINEILRAVKQLDKKINKED